MEFATSTAHLHGHHHSSVTSLASLATAHSEDTSDYQTCYEGGFGDGNLSSRAPSFVCLQDVAEEASEPWLTKPLAALGTDIHMLKRPPVAPSSIALDTNNNTTTTASHHKKPIDLSRDRLMIASAMPMSRSFATPRATMATVYASNSTSSTSSRSSTSNMSTSESMTSLASTTSSACSMSHMTIAKKQQPRQRVKQLRISDLHDDVQWHVLSFLDLDSCRAVLATCRSYRKLLLAQGAQTLWATFLRQPWPQCSATATLVDDLRLPTACAAGSAPLHQHANLSVLLHLAHPNPPTDIDQEQLQQYVHWRRRLSRRRRLRRLVRNNHMDNDDEAPASQWLQYNYSDYYKLKAVKFTGPIGVGDRCVRANQALPRATVMEKSTVTPQWLYAYTHAQALSSSRYFPPGKAKGARNAFLAASNQYPEVGHPSLLDMFCRSAKAVVRNRPTGAWKPFVAPFVTNNNNTVNVTPRFVSYFEVSILEEPNEDGQLPSQQQSNSSNEPTNDCVAVGVATESFDWQSRMPGWDAFSFGYHGDDGGIFHSSGGMLRKFGPSFGRGDTVGCGIDYITQGIFYTLNGEFVGYAWKGVSMDILSQKLYPVVGIDTQDLIACNYGNERPFEFDLTPLMLRHEELVHHALAASSSLASSTASKRKRTSQHHQNLQHGK